MNWGEKRVLITGGASFIGSHLADALVSRGAAVRIADNLSSGRQENVQHLIDDGSVDFHEVDLLDPIVADAMVKDVDIVFHNAADHGGRGYIDLHPVNCSTNMILDGIVFRAADKANVDKCVFASSGCVYPNGLQTNPEEIVYLTEDVVGPPYDADNLYGWAKLMGEEVLRAYVQEGRMKAASLRYFTAYGPRCPENHAVMAMTARALVNQIPFIVWGTGEQIRNWTHVDDIVEGTILAAEKIDDGSAVNLGTMERTKVVDAVREILEYTDKDLPLEFDPSKPTGPYNRVCDNSLAQKLLGWKPQISFREGLHRTIDWYAKTHKAEEVKENLEGMLIERKHGTRS